MEIKKYINGMRKIAPYLRESAKESIKETAVGITLGVITLTGLSCVEKNISEVQEPQYTNKWQVKRNKNSVIAERGNLVSYIRLIDDDKDGIVDKKIRAFPRPGCYKTCNPSKFDQEIFTKLTKN